MPLRQTLKPEDVRLALISGLEAAPRDSAVIQLSSLRIVLRPDQWLDVLAEDKRPEFLLGDLKDSFKDVTNPKTSRVMRAETVQNVSVQVERLLSVLKKADWKAPEPFDAAKYADALAKREADSILGQSKKPASKAKGNEGSEQTVK